MTQPPLTRREEVALEAAWAALRDRYVEATRQGYVGTLLLVLTLGESNSGHSVARSAIIRRDDQVRLTLP